MKALLIAFSFLLLFSIVVFSSRKGTVEFVYDSFLYLKKEDLPLQILCKAQSSLFQSAQRKTPAAKHEPFAEAKKTQVRQRVHFGRDNEMSKINLAFLKDKELYPKTREQLGEILFKLYGPSPKRPALIHSLEEAMSFIDELSESMQEAGANVRLRDIKLSSKKNLFYHLIQGTQKFDLKGKEGVIPFEDLFIFYQDTPKAILFCKAASTTSIGLLFSEEFAEKLTEQEKDLQELNKSRLSASEWRALIQREGDDAIREEAFQWVSFTSKGPPKVKTLGVDSETGLRMEGPPAGKKEEEIE